MILIVTTSYSAVIQFWKVCSRTADSYLARRYCEMFVLSKEYLHLSVTLKSATVSHPNPPTSPVLSCRLLTEDHTKDTKVTKNNISHVKSRRNIHRGISAYTSARQAVLQMQHVASDPPNSP